MSRQPDFTDLVERMCSDVLKQHALVPSGSNLGPPERIRFENAAAALEFAYGPPEYHVELTLVRKMTGELEQRVSLAELIRIPRIAEWMIGNRLTSSNEDRAAAEVAWYCRLLTACVPSIEDAVQQAKTKARA